jgi:hypothetical protein
MIVYKFCRTALYELCLGEFEVSPSAKLNFHTHDTVDVSEFTLLHTYLYENNKWVKKDIDTLYSIVQLNGAAVFPKRQLVKSNLERGFYAFTSHSAQYFEDYRIHFQFHVDSLKEQSINRECSS